MLNYADNIIYYMQSRKKKGNVYIVQLEKNYYVDGR